VALKIADTSSQDIKLAPPDPWRKRLLLAGVGVALIALTTVAIPWVQRWANATVTVDMERVRTATVERGDLVRDVSVQGRVVAAVSPTLYATAPGTITLAVDAGACQALAPRVGRSELSVLRRRIRDFQCHRAPLPRQWPCRTDGFKELDARYRGFV